MHIRFVYGNESAVKKYCNALLGKEKLWIEETNTTLKEASASYELLEFCDAFSLLICQGLVQPENRKMEISDGPDGVTYQLCLADGGQLVVTPWPSEEELFKINYECRRIPQLVFSSDDGFKKKLLSGSVKFCVLTISDGLI